MESSNKRSAQTPPQRPDVKKSKTIDNKDTPPPAKKEPVSVNSTRGNKLVLPKRRVKPLEKKEVILEAIIQEVKEGKLSDKKECMWPCWDSSVCTWINH